MSTTDHESGVGNASDHVDSPLPDVKSAAEESPYGRRTIIGFIEQTARDNPSKVYGWFPYSKDLEDGFREVTYLQLSQAIDRGAWWFEQCFGKGSRHPTIAWIGPFDLRYVVLPLAANKAGYKLLLLSPRNSLEYQFHLLETSDCHIILSESTVAGSQAIIDSAENLKSVPAPTVDELFRLTAVDPYPWEEGPAALSKPLVIVHSSGSTGLPTGILWTHSSLASLDRQHLLPSQDGFPSLFTSLKPGTLLTLFPPFHAAGLLFSMSWAPFYGHKIIFPPIGQLKGQTVLDVLRYIKFDTLAAAPSVLEDLSEATDALENLRSIKNIFFGGAPMSEQKGSRLAKYTKLWNAIGTTESGMTPIKVHDEDDFNYFRFPMDLHGMRFEEYDEGAGLYELQWIRDSETDQFHCAWTSMPWLEIYPTKDLFRKHPTKPGLFKHFGRLDDVIVFSNGEKLVATTMEQTIKGSPIVKNALVFGQGRAEIGLLLEPTASASELSSAEIIAEIKPYVKKSNASMPSHALLSLDMILITSPEKPMVCTAKGSVVRSQTWVSYAQEIDQLYSSNPSSVDSGPSILAKNQSIEQISAALITIYEDILSKSIDLKEDDDVFSKGFDSLCIMKAVRRIRAALEAEGYHWSKSITPALLYSAPTIMQLATTLQGMMQEEDKDVPPGLSLDNEATEQARLHQMQVMIQKYCRFLSSVVLLTGSTGFLGPYILDALINSNSVTAIFVINRSTDGGLARHKETSHTRNLSSDFSKVTFLHADLSMPSLDLSKENYSLLQNSAQIVIHNQWPVNFNLPLKSFEPHLAGLRNLLDMAVLSSNKPCFLFVSSVSAIAHYKDCHDSVSDGSIPETIPENTKAAMHSGYGMSKYIGEHIIEAESQHSKLRTAILRLGQVAGPVSKLGGVWKKQEWLPSLVLSSHHLKMVPDDIGEVDWMPADLLGDALVQISLYERQSGVRAGTPTTVYNIANPYITNWTTDIIPTLLTYLPQGTRTVSLGEWAQALKASIQEAENDITQADMEANPAARLLSFYEDTATRKPIRMGAKMEIQRAKTASRVIQDMKAVNGEWISLWMQSWGLTRLT